MIENVFLITAIILIIYAFLKWMTMYYGYFDKIGVAHLKPVFLLGNTFGLFTKQFTPPEYITKLYTSFPNEKIIGLFDFRVPFFVVRDPDVIKKLTIRDFEYFLNHRTFLAENTDRLFGNSLLLLRDDKWRDMRATLSPAFTGSKLRQMFELITECAHGMSKYFQEVAAVDGKLISLDMKETFSRYTTDVIATCAFGIKIDSFRNPDNDFFEMGKNIFKFNSVRNVMRLVFLRMTPFLMRLLNIEFIDKKVTNFFKSMVMDNIEIREKEGIFRPDMINIMMQIKKGQSLHENTENNANKLSDGFATVEETNIRKGAYVTRSWNDDEIAAQCFIFFAAGFDTSSTLLTFASYELATNLDIQQRLYEEICNTNEQLNGKRISYEVLQKMQYMDMVISETLRKRPTLAFTDRICVKDYQYDDGEKQFKFDKGVPFWIPIYGLHHDPKYFPNPECFDPERFNEENRKNINLGAYLPFGTGPRNCIGSRFALMEIKAILYYILLHFQLIPNEKTVIPLKLGKSPFNIVFENGMHLDLKPRKH